MRVTTSSDTAAQDTRPLVTQACRAAGLDPTGAEPVRIADNAIWSLPGRIVIRITRPGRRPAARRELLTAQWLAEHHLPAVRPAHPTAVDLPGNRAATFWEQLPEHTVGRHEDVARLLCRLHQLPAPAHLPTLADPATKARSRLETLPHHCVISEADMGWLLGYAEELADAWRSLDDGLAPTPLHGDAWAGNVARTPDGQCYLLDLDSAAVGPPEWDLTSTAVKVDTTATIPLHEYARFVTAYGGHDVRDYAGFPVMRGIRELRMTTYAIQTATDHPHTAVEARHRVACLRGRNGPRPWRWTAVPHPPGSPGPIV
ncbi:phosphotransferase family protein [Streptomyces sp. cg36]|uniref:phosphotransferase family protein n=1 Tax=Streptomyces sp. cg36 TaxID=3238798 RepID=UPI0034E29BF6